MPLPKGKPRRHHLVRGRSQGSANTSWPSGALVSPRLIPMRDGVAPVRGNVRQGVRWEGGGKNENGGAAGRQAGGVLYLPPPTSRRSLFLPPGVRYVLNPPTTGCLQSERCVSKPAGWRGSRDSNARGEPGTIEGSQMPRHLISDAHEWINEIPTVPTCRPAKSQPRERAWQSKRGKKTLLSLTVVWPCYAN